MDRYDGTWETALLITDRQLQERNRIGYGEKNLSSRNYEVQREALRRQLK